ncbi:Sterol carrier protein domain-containing protein [Marvinbryantia formatexigens]|nr:Sterol carrier protein domain-containing protein [Marvinbryantia formatexigens]
MGVVRAAAAADRGSDMHSRQKGERVSDMHNGQKAGKASDMYSRQEVGKVSGIDSSQKVDGGSGVRNTQKVKSESRALWEMVFPEDTQQFLDYYDTFVADHNKIYMDFVDGQAVAMLHRNPYRICMGNLQADTSYIVAVATREEYRHQGRMKKLLLEAFADSFREGEPFVYLMPVSEKIYLPFGFRTVYYQNILTLGSVFAPAVPKEEEVEVRAASVEEPGVTAHGQAVSGAGIRCGQKVGDGIGSYGGRAASGAGIRYGQRVNDGAGIICRRAQHSQLAGLADFSERVLSESGVVHTKRDTAYYERIWKEQEAVNGGILLFYTEEEPDEACGKTGWNEGTDEAYGKTEWREGADEACGKTGGEIYAETGGSNSGIKLRLRGWCFTGLEDAAEVWELVLDTKNPFLYAQALRAVTEHFREELPVKVSGLLPGTEIAGVSSREYAWRPMTMVRITNLYALAEKIRAPKPFACFLHIKDEWIPQNNGWFSLQVSGRGGRLEKIDNPGSDGAAQEPGAYVKVAQAQNGVCWEAAQEQFGACGRVVSELPCLEMTIQELTDALFGIRPHPVLEAAGIEPLHPLYFNELV